MSNYLFNQVTGQSDYERQSWRDSYNGGRAAGDWTGNVNRELDAQREANNGRTESGSSSQYAAFEVAPIRQGNPAAAVGAGAPKSAGPGNEVVRQGSVTPGRPAGGSGAGSRLTITGLPWPVGESPPAVSFRGLDGPIPMRSGIDVPGRQFPFLGLPLEANPYTPSAQAIEDEMGEGEFLSPGWFANWAKTGADFGWNVERSADYVFRNYSQPFYDAAAQRINAPLPKQEAVDWGR